MNHPSGSGFASVHDAQGFASFGRPAEALFSPVCNDIEANVPGGDVTALFESLACLLKPARRDLYCGPVVQRCRSLDGPAQAVDRLAVVRRPDVFDDPRRVWRPLGGECDGLMVIDVTLAGRDTAIAVELAILGVQAVDLRDELIGRLMKIGVLRQIGGTEQGADAGRADRLDEQAGVRRSLRMLVLVV